jgi:hypothetical protein
MILDLCDQSPSMVTKVAITSSSLAPHYTHLERPPARRYTHPDR